MQKKSVLNKFVRGLIAVAVIGALFSMGFIFELNSPVYYVLFFVTLGVIAILFIYNVIISTVISRRANMLTLDGQEQILAKIKAEVRRDQKAFEKATMRSIIICRVFTILCLLLAAAGAFFAGAAMYMLMANKAEGDEIGEFVVMLAVAAIAMAAMVYSLLPIYDEGQKPQIIPKSEMPEIYRIVQRAAVNMRCRLAIDICAGDQISIALLGKRIIINLDPLMVGFLTADELYACMLHEFAHFSNNDFDFSYKYQIASWRLGQQSTRVAPLMLFSCFVSIAQDRVNNLMQFSTERYEIKADKAAALHGSPQALVNGLAKSEYVGIFGNHTTREFAYDIFAGEHFPSNYSEIATAAFHRCLAENKDTWTYIAMHRLQGKYDTHPTLSERMKNVGVTSFSIDDVETDAKYLADVRVLQADFDKRLKWEFAEQYDLVRDESYVNRKEKMEMYDNAVAEGRTLNLDELLGAANAFYALDREKAKDIALSILENHPTAADANKILGDYYAEKLDNRCLDYYQEWAERRPTDSMEALECIETYTLFKGDKQLYDENAAEIKKTAQAAIDRQKATSLVKKTKLEKSDLPDEFLRDLFIYANQQLGDTLKKMYCVKAVGEKSYYFVVWRKSRVFWRMKSANADMTNVFVSIGHISSYISAYSDNWIFEVLVHNEQTARAARVRGACLDRKKILGY